MKTYINGHCIEQILTNVMYLTQNEYDNLSQYDKTHGSYIITDAPEEDIPASDITYDNTTSGLTADNVQDAIDELAEGGGSGGHTIINDSGTTLAQKTNLQFKGVYTQNNGDNTEVDICRTMTKAQMEALSGEALKGFINTSDEPDSLPLTTDWVETDNGDSLTDRISDIEDGIESASTATGTTFVTGVSVKDILGYKSSVTPTTSGKSTLLEYIQDVLRPKGYSIYSFGCSGFSDLPSTDWGYTITINFESGAAYIQCYKHQSVSDTWGRSINAQGQWITGWIPSGIGLRQLSIGSPTLSNRTRTYTVPNLGTYAFLCITTFVENWNWGNTEIIPVINDMHKRIQYTEGGSNWKCEISMDITNNTVSITTSDDSTNPDTNPITIARCYTLA